MIFSLQFRFLNYLQGELPSYWLRYSEGVVVEMIEATAALLSCSYGNPSMLGPVHYMSLFDPKATWFRKWTVREAVVICCCYCCCCMCLLFACCLLVACLLLACCLHVVYMLLLFTCCLHVVTVVVLLLFFTCTHPTLSPPPQHGQTSRSMVTESLRKNPIIVSLTHLTIA